MVVSPYHSLIPCVLAEIPIDKNFNIQEINKKKLYARTKTFSIFWTMFTGIVWKLEAEYWVSHCGNDAYLYLLFQRKFGKLALLLTFISIITSIGINSLKQEEVEKGGLSAFFDRAILDNKEMTDYRSWYHVIMVLIITSMTIRVIKRTRDEAKESYTMQHKQMSRRIDHEWLKARTLHIKGIPAEDRTGSGLKTILDNFLKDKDGKVVAM